MNPLTNIKNITKLSEQELTKGWKTSWHDQYKDSAWVFIGGLPFDLSEGDIITVFSQYGEIATVNLVRDKDTGKSRGFCFLCYENQRSTILAVDNFNGMKLLKRTIRVDHVQDYKPPKAPKKKPGENGEQPSDIQPQGILPPVKLEPRVVQDVKNMAKAEVENSKSSKKIKKSKKKSKKQEEISSDSGEEMERKKRCKKKQKQASSSSSSSSESSSSSSSSSDSSESSSSSSEDDKSKSKKHKKQKKRKRSPSSESSSSSDEDDKKSKHKKKGKKQKHSSKHAKKSDIKPQKSSKLPEKNKSDNYNKYLPEVKIKQEVLTDDEVGVSENFQKNKQSDRKRGMSRWDNKRESHSELTNNIDREIHNFQEDNTSNQQTRLSEANTNNRQTDNYRNDSRRQQSTGSDKKPYNLNERSSRDQRSSDDRYEKRREDPSFRQAYRDFGEKRDRRRDRSNSIDRRNKSKETQLSPSYEKSKLTTERRRSRSNERKRYRSPSPYRRRGPDIYKH